MFPTIPLGPAVLPTAGVIYLLGAWFALSAIETAAKRLRLPVEATYGLGVMAFVAGIIGARALFVVEYWAAFQDNLVGIIWPLNSGYNIWGGVVIGVIGAFFYGRYKQLPPADTLDAIAPGLYILLIAVSLADFAAGPGYGALTSMPWGVSMYGLRRHPVQLYEVAGGLLALFIWWRAHPHRTFAGQAFILSAIFYAAARLITDTYRVNAWVTASGYHILQIISLLVILGGMYILMRQSTKEIKA
jgi:phosphatidylglycerol:prolipoprotein diacylglycerol transferase